MSGSDSQSWRIQGVKVTTLHRGVVRQRHNGGHSAVDKPGFSQSVMGKNGETVEIIGI